MYKKFQDTKNKEHEKTQKQIKDLTEDFNKIPNETKDTIKREIYESKMIIKNIKEKLIKMWKTSEKRIKHKSWI
jgi:ElaB/YqjD/DUF883 family membrane-anchored ribosome-binding protein